MPTAGEVIYTRQQEAKGLGHAVWCARHMVGDEPFAVMLVDDLIHAEPSCLAQMVEAQRGRRGGNMLAVMEVPQEHTSRYGVIDPGTTGGRLTEVRGMVEKPQPDVAPSRLAVIGRYILMPEVFAMLDAQKPGAGGEIQLTDAMARLIGRQPFHGYRFDGRRFDCGDKLGYLEAIVALAARREDLQPRLFRDAARATSEPAMLRSKDLRMQIAMIGTGYVGLVSGACFAEFGLEVVCVDKDAGKIGMLEAGQDPDLRAGAGRAGRDAHQRRPAHLHHRPRSSDRRCGGGVHRRRHAVAAR